ncbi:pentatricopeptide repeat-containing protein At4g04790, mitochondrial isoform X2 [Glycine max]|nr:pentatricopeptide repeat-containing protein At4g04790, mitochondrial isoform X2 [Glycine max]XP_040863644.1 pentatricopeptide repeat-containing protein At4g04790, mitochondrial isoform X2 [Glycine max]
MKDFEGAFRMIADLEDMNFKPTTNMYNAIMAGYFREKNISGVLRVLKKMRGANVKPDSQTFSYLIRNCEKEEDIMKYCEEIKQSGVQATKQIFMALINSYAASGKMEKAKQVVLDPIIPNKSLNEIKSVLVSALASHGQLSEALLVYEEIKKAGHNLRPKAVITLIEELTKFNGELDGLLLLLEEISDLDYWVDGCFKVIMYCIRNKNLSSAIVLFKQLKDKFKNDEIVTEALFDAVFSLIAVSEFTHLQIGLDLLWAIKDELGLMASRQCLDFLLSACANAGDLNNARLIWREYEVAGFPYNVLSYLRMYQALLAAGDDTSAHLILKKIPQDDAEICSVIIACQETYNGLNSVEEKKKQGKKRKKKKSKT